MPKVNNKDTGVVLVSLLLTLDIFHTFSSVSIINFEQVNVCWVENKKAFKNRQGYWT